VLLPLLGRGLGGPRFASLARTGFVAAMIALAIEFLQSQVPSRVPDVDAVLLNTLGVAVTHQLCYGPLRALAREGTKEGVAPRGARDATPVTV
jgi:VanZ family protein